MLETELRKVHFIGIGGIGMSALAHYFISKNINVSGLIKLSLKSLKVLKYYFEY